MHRVMVIKGSLVIDSAHAVTGSTPVVMLQEDRKKLAVRPNIKLHMQNHGRQKMNTCTAVQCTIE